MGEEINNIPQETLNEHLGHAPSCTEVASAIKGMASEWFFLSSLFDRNKDSMFFLTWSVC
jgi:hypothetical protein